MTRIEIADSEWCDWPTDPGDWLAYSSKWRIWELLPMIDEHDVNAGTIDIGGGYVARSDDFRFARVELPIVPQVKDDEPCQPSKD